MKTSCHVSMCRRDVVSGMVMCVEHWHGVPRWLQRHVLQTFLAGQAQPKPTPEYLRAARLATLYVEVKQEATKCQKP